MYTNENSVLHTGAAAATSFAPFNNATWNQPTLLKGKAQVTTTNSGNDLGFSIPNLPVGNYKVQISGILQPGGAGATGASISCNYKIVETTTSTDVAKQAVETKAISATLNTRDFANSFTGVFQNTSVATRNFRLEANKQTDTSPGAIGYCQAFSGTGTTGQLNSNITFLLTPLDNNSNSALYVQGPVKAAATGTAIPAGYVGEVKTSSAIPISTVSAGAWVLASSGVTLTPGVWLVSGGCEFNYPGANVATACMISTTNSTLGNIFPDQNWQQITWVAGAFPHNARYSPRVITITSPTLLYFGAVNITVAVVNSQHILQAVRLN